MLWASVAALPEKYREHLVDELVQRVLVARRAWAVLHPNQARPDLANYSHEYDALLDSMLTGLPFVCEALHDMNGRDAERATVEAAEERRAREAKELPKDLADEIESAAARGRAP